MGAPAIAHIPEQHHGPEPFAGFISEETTGPQMTVLPDLWPDTSISVIVVESKRESSRKALAETVEVKESAPATQQNYALTGDDHQTNTTTLSALIVLLEERAEAGDHQTFATLVEAIDWSARPPEELITAIDLALSQEMAALAIKLAQLGGRLFPDHERIQRVARVLAPPVVRTVQAPSVRGLDASMAWFDEHASQYRGRWVAVREGQLLGAAESLEELMPVIGEGEDAVSTIVTRVL